jgi:hypothetical protein
MPKSGTCTPEAGCREHDVGRLDVAVGDSQCWCAWVKPLAATCLPGV